MTTATHGLSRRGLSRRSLLVALAPLALAACGGAELPPLSVGKPAGAPEADRVTRLLVWLPPASHLFDSSNIAKSVRAKFAAIGVAVDVGTSQPLELDRAAAQRPLIASFRPSHLLELEMSSATSTGSVSLVSVTGRLYASTGRAPIRTVGFLSRGRAGGTSAQADKIADELVQKLQASGISFS
jgi:hypothetical protein